MAKTRWSLDTCECKLLIEWDNQQALKERKHTYTFESRCARHEAAGARPGDVVEENRAKNFGVGEVSRVSGIPANELAWERNEDGFSVRRVK